MYTTLHIRSVHLGMDFKGTVFNKKNYERQIYNKVLLDMRSTNNKFYQKNMHNLDKKVNPQQSTVCLEQQICASQENFTPSMLVMLETFRRSVSIHI